MTHLMDSFGSQPPLTTRAVPVKVRNLFIQATAELRAQNAVNEQSIEKLKRMVEGENGVFAPIPDDLIAAFNSCYFERNLLKCLIVLDRFKKSIESKAFLDFGCGMGTASLAWTRLAGLSPQQTSLSVAVDRNVDQLKSAKCNFLFQTEESFLPSFYNSLDHVTPSETERLFLMCFSLCELYAENTDVVSFMDNASRELVIIDYREILTQLIKDFGSELIGTSMFHDTYLLGDDLSYRLGQKTLRVAGLYAEKRV